MFQRILVPLDGSQRAEYAVPIAARIARSFGGSIILLYVAAPPISPGKFSTLETYPKKITDEELAEASSYLQTLAQSDILHGIPTEVQTLVGATASSIIAAAQAFNASLITLCSHGHTGFKRWMLGSVAEKVIRHAPLPVLVLREGGPEPLSERKHVLRALIALDGSALSEAILEPAVSLLTGLALTASQQRTLQLLRVVDIPLSYGRFRSSVDSYYDNQLRAEAKQECEQHLEAVAKRLVEGEGAKSDLVISTHVAINPDVAEAIVQAAERAKVDFIAIATHGRGGVQHWALGSTTERVLHATNLPLLILRPCEVARQSQPTAEH